MKEKKFLKWIFIWGIIIVAAYLAVSTVMSLALDNTLTERCLNLTNTLQNYSDTEPFEISDLKCRTDNEELLEIKNIEKIGDEIYWTLEPTMNGSGKVFITVENTRTGHDVESAIIRVTKRGLLVDMVTKNFSHYHERQLCMVGLILAIAILLWVAYARSIKELRFSYHSIFCVGLAIWVSVIFIIVMVEYLQGADMMSLYGTLQGASSSFATFTFPLTFVFALLLTISNISLIRHEGFRVNNALGIVISAIMIFGFIALILFGNIISSGWVVTINIWEAITEVLETVYALLECFLIGAIICGSRAAKHKPEFDMDYIVILGCKIRSDGSLYPLIRGRVDRAIRFYNDQLAATGKKAVFIPSGGKGSNEPMSEAEGMRNYLLEQGIEEAQIIPEMNSKNTRQNMEFSKEIVGEGKKAVFSTTNFHVFRSGIIAGQVDFDADGMGSPTKWYFWPNAYIREVIGMLSYKWKSLVIVFIPIVCFLTVVRFAF